MYEPVIDHSSGLNAEDSALTPIFHALVNRIGDPSAEFGRDPLSAPMPASAPPPALTRMLLHAVPGGHAETLEPAVYSGASHGSRELRAVGSHTGRHRAVRPTGHGAFGQ